MNGENNGCNNKLQPPPPPPQTQLHALPQQQPQLQLQQPRLQPHSRATIRKQNAISVTLTSDSADTTHLDDENDHVGNEITPINSLKPSTMNSSSSSWSSNCSGDRHRSCINNKFIIAANGPVGANSLSLPSSPARKLSLQPFKQHNLSQLNDCYSGNARKKSIAFNDATVSKQNSQQQHQNSDGSINNFHNIDDPTNCLWGSVSNLNSNVTNQARFAPRKSVIGRLERSSFQAQRLSDVGVAFGQQITAKMGLKLPASQERIVEQTRWLYLRYVFVKLRQNALPIRDLNLTKSSSRARRAAAILSKLPDVTCSEPSSGIPSLIANSERFANIGGNRKFCRKRTVSQSINSQDLSFLAARMQTIKLKGDFDHLSSVRSNVNDTDSHNIKSEQASGANSNTTNNSTSSSQMNKKYIMDPTINNQIFTVIVKIIKELRDLKPEFYGDTIYELIGMDKFSSLQTLLDVQKTICQEMIRSEISWCRISALFSFFGAMSLDCIRLGAPENVGPILDGFIEFIERDLALWISQQGGWESFLYKYKAGSRFGSLTSRVVTIALPIVVWALLYFFE